MKRIVVLGGSGFVGRSLCEALCDGVPGGVQIVVPTRRRERAKPLFTLPSVEVIEASVHDDGQLARVLAGADAVVNLIAILHGSAQQFEAVHVAWPHRLAEAMLAAGVHRLVHVSALGVPDEPGAPGASMYLSSKSRGEAGFHSAATRGLALTVLRPSVIFGAQDQFLNLFARLQAVAPVMPLAGAHATFQPVWVQDVARAIVACLNDASTVGATYDLAGPEVLTLADLVRLAGEASGHPRPVVPVPILVGRLQAAVLGFLPGEPLMSSDNLASMSVPNVASGRRPGLRELGIEPASVRTIAPGYLRHATPARDLWRRWGGR